MTLLICKGSGQNFMRRPGGFGREVEREKVMAGKRRDLPASPLFLPSKNGKVPFPCFVTLAGLALPALWGFSCPVAVGFALCPPVAVAVSPVGLAIVRCGCGAVVTVGQFCPNWDRFGPHYFFIPCPCPCVPSCPLSPPHSPHTYFKKIVDSTHRANYNTQ